ncbi:MAG: peptidoglycan bridge formation glycyltransferase FemA/FemB family protein [Bacteroidetes bacterium]|nr:peptidoglycan bridge formation glycyltransferase FemA/FemB family protein [Bacteroidota bacterium]
MITITCYTDSHYEEWDSFVRDSNNGTIFHSQRFLSYHPAERFQFHHLMFYDNNKLVAVLPAALRENGTSLESPIGSSYGGIVLSVMNYKKHEEIVDSLLEYAKEQGFAFVFLTPAPFFYQIKQMQNIDYALAFKGFEFDRHYISHIIEHGTTEQYFKGFNATARNSVRQFNRNDETTIEITTLQSAYEEIYPILVENKIRHDARPTHSLEEMLRLQDLFPNSITLIIARHGESRKAIAASWVIGCNSKVTLCFYNMMLYKYEHLHPMYAVMNEVVGWSVRRGSSFVDIGVSQDTKNSNPMTPSYSLIDFKEKFGAVGMLRSTFKKML